MQRNFEDWKAEVIKITAKETKTNPKEIKLNESVCKKWFDSGMSPYFAFRESWQS